MLISTGWQRTALQPAGKKKKTKTAPTTAPTTAQANSQTRVQGAKTKAGRRTVISPSMRNGCFTTVHDCARQLLAQNRLTCTKIVPTGRSTAPTEFTKHGCRRTARGHAAKLLIPQRLFAPQLLDLLGSRLLNLPLHRRRTCTNDVNTGHASARKGNTKSG